MSPTTIYAVSEELRRNSHLYTSSPMSKQILRQYFGLGESAIVPLSISHGIDFEHENHPQDIINAEPIHWAYNNRIFARSRRVKPAITLPHPWTMLHELLGRPFSKKNGKKIIIGPPPSRTNDHNLYECIKNSRLRANSILIKSRGSAKMDASYGFWKSHGVTPLTAGDRDNEHFMKLMNIFGEHEFVISPVFSSATILASAIGCKVIMLENYSHTSYAVRSLNLRRMCESDLLQQLVRAFSNEGCSNITMEFSSELLGTGYLGRKANQLIELEELFSSVKKPLYVPAARGNRFLETVLGEVARVTGRSSFLKYGVLKGVKYKIFATGSALVCKRMNLIHALLHGLSADNLQVRDLTASEHSVRAGEGGDF